MKRILILVTAVALLFATSCKNDKKEVEKTVEETVEVVSTEEKGEVSPERADITSRVKAIVIDQLGIDEDVASIKANFKNDLGADELDIMELIMQFEKEFDIQIPDNQIEKLSTIGEAIDFIDKMKEN